MNKTKIYRRKYLWFICCLIISLMFCACDSIQEAKHDSVVSCEYDGSLVVVSVDTFTTYKYQLNIGSVLVDSGVIGKNKEFILPQIIKGNVQGRKEMALDAAKNDCLYEIRLLINDVLDTTFTYRQSFTDIQDDNTTFTGFGAPLVRKNKREDFGKELRVWLYRKHEHLDDSIFECFRKIYAELSLTGDNEYIPMGNIPVVHDIDGCRYKINCDVQADYYAVVACQNQAYINQYIEQLVGNNFDGVSTSLLSPLPCHYKKGTTGYKNVFLLCINKDWSYKQIPVATFALDNSAPNASFYDASSVSYRRSRYYYPSEKNSTPKEPASLSYNNRIKVIYPSNKPKIFGDASVSVTNWDGNGVECNVTFRVELSGDAKSATIQRHGELCYYNKYLGYHFKPEDKVIYAKDHNGPYKFTYKMHFDNGDNIIPVIVEDYNGNKHKGSITINAEFVRSDAPSINIDNNIDIYNN